MPFTLIKGTFHVTGYSPDGDTIRFQAADPTLWARLAGPPVRRNARGHASLRFEGIDALETHFDANGQRYHQPLALAHAATDSLFAAAGITAVEWDAAHQTVLAANDGTPGFILSRAVETNRRAVAFVYAGTTVEPDGADIFLDRALLRDSINYKLAEVGLVYPTYYQGLFPDLRAELTEAIVAARAAGLGLWPVDRTTSGVVIDGLEGLQEVDAVLPKLFRRIVSYVGDGGAIAGFKQFLADDPDPLLILATGHFTNLDTLVSIDGMVVRLEAAPEGLVFIPQ